MRQEAGVAVIGAGMAGLACARGLFAAFRPVTVLEKSRRLGGRLATRRVGTLAFDYGAQYVVARDPGLQDYLDLACATGYAQSWVPVYPGLKRLEPWLVGVPGMSALLQPLAKGVDVCHGVHVVSCERRDEQWWLKSESGDELGPFGSLVLAMPLPEALVLIQDLPDAAGMAANLNSVRIAPCWAVMAGFPERFDTLADFCISDTGSLAWAARDVSKPGRRSPHDCWVLHASGDWTRDRLEMPATAVGEALLADFGKWTGKTPSAAYVAAHLWRYARVEQPLNVDCLWDAGQQLGLCGDWCLGAQVEAAWLSGSALARQLLRSGRAV